MIMYINNKNGDNDSTLSAIKVIQLLTLIDGREANVGSLRLYSDV